MITIQWRHIDRDGVTNHWRLDALLNLLFRLRSKKTSKLRVTGLCEGNSPVTDEFPSQRASNAENASIWWRHHEDKLLQPRVSVVSMSLNVYLFECLPVNRALSECPLRHVLAYPRPRICNATGIIFSTTKATIKGPLSRLALISYNS